MFCNGIKDLYYSFQWSDQIPSSNVGTKWSCSVGSPLCQENLAAMQEPPILDLSLIFNRFPWFSLFVSIKRATWSLSRPCLVNCWFRLMFNLFQSWVDEWYFVLWFSRLPDLSCYHLGKNLNKNHGIHRKATWFFNKWAITIWGLSGSSKYVNCHRISHENLSTNASVKLKNESKHPVKTVVTWSSKKNGNHNNKQNPQWRTISEIGGIHKPCKIVAEKALGFITSSESRIFYIYDWEVMSDETWSYKKMSEHKDPLSLSLSYTNSTAQVSCGSFKDRKPNWEVSCCDWWIAERTDGPKGGWGSESFYLYLSLSPSLCVSPSSLSLSISIFLSVQLAVWSWGADFEMCFASQWRAIFAHRNFQKWSENEVLLVFWLPNLLRATTACSFWSLIASHGSAPASLANSITFRPSTATRHMKKKLRDFVHISTHLDLPSTDSFSSASFISDSVSSDSSPTAPTTVAASVRRKLDL